MYVVCIVSFYKGENKKKIFDNINNLYFYENLSYISSGNISIIYSINNSYHIFIRTKYISKL